MQISSNNKKFVANDLIPFLGVSLFLCPPVHSSPCAWRRDWTPKGCRGQYPLAWRPALATCPSVKSEILAKLSLSFSKKIKVSQHNKLPTSQWRKKGMIEGGREMGGLSWSLFQRYTHGGERVRMLELSPINSVLGWFLSESKEPLKLVKSRGEGGGDCCFAKGREEWLNFLLTEGSWERSWWIWYSMGTRREKKEKRKQKNTRWREIQKNASICEKYLMGRCRLRPLTPTIFGRGHTFQGMFGVVGFLTETGEEAEFYASAGVGSALQMREETAHPVAAPRAVGSWSWLVHKGWLSFSGYCKLFVKHGDY